MNDYVNWTPEQIEDLINDVYNGTVNRAALPRGLYEAIVEVLYGAISSGLGELGGEGGAASDLLIQFQQNINVFSAAKTFQQINDMSNFLLDEAGEKISFSQFKKHATEIFEEYNVNWLKTEFNTAFANTQSAANWVQIEADADVLPLLKYSTVGDGRVRDTHRALNDIVRPVKDAFWLDNYPPNDWNCRCIVTQHAKGEVKVTSDKDLEAADLPKIPALFQNNPAKSGYIFKEDAHPYYTVDKRYERLKKDNFGL